VYEQLGPSATEFIQSDKRLQNEQLGALDSLKEMGDMGGFTLEERAAQNKINNTTARHESAGRASIANDFASRGQLGSNAQLAMSLQNQQDSANRSAQTGLGTAASAQKRYFDSKLKGAELAGQMDDRDYHRKMDAAKSRDLISQHNADARDKTAASRNSVAQQQFGNNITKISGQVGQDAKMANFLGDQGAQKAERIARTGDAVAKFAGSLDSRDDDEDDE
jgi:hypothetical protein